MPLPKEILDDFDKAYLLANNENNKKKLQRIRDYDFEMSRKGLLRLSAYKTGAKEIYEKLFMEFGQDLWSRMQRVIPSDSIHTFDLEKETKDYFLRRLNEYFINGSESLKGHQLDATNEWFSNSYRSVKEHFEFEIIAEVKKLKKENPPPQILSHLKEHIHRDLQHREMLEAVRQGKQNTEINVTGHNNVIQSGENLVAKINPKVSESKPEKPHWTLTPSFIVAMVAALIAAAGLYIAYKEYNPPPFVNPPVIYQKDPNAEHLKPANPNFTAEAHDDFGKEPIYHWSVKLQIWN